MFNLRFSCLPLLFIAFIKMSMAGSNSLELTVQTTVRPGTCTMQLYDNNHSPGSTINIGDVYIPEIINKSKAVSFSLVFSDCTGLAKEQAVVIMTSATGCDGVGGSGNSYKNALSGAGAASGVSAEVWTTETPQSTGSKQLTCKSAPQNIVDVSGAKDQNTVVWPLSTRIVPETGKTTSDLQPGSFSTQAVFTVQYE
ncbi:fimbrial protein [Salmonella enterica subsp. enterica]